MLPLGHRPFLLFGHGYCLFYMFTFLGIALLIYFGLIARSLLVGHSPPLWLLPFLHATFLGIALPFVLVVIALNILQAVAVKPCKV